LITDSFFALLAAERSQPLAFLLFRARWLPHDGAIRRARALSVVILTAVHRGELEAQHVLIVSQHNVTRRTIRAELIIGQAIDEGLFQRARGNQRQDDQRGHEQRPGKPCLAHAQAFFADKELIHDHIEPSVGNRHRDDRQKNRHSAGHCLAILEWLAAGQPPFAIDPENPRRAHYQTDRQPQEYDQRPTRGCQIEAAQAHSQAQAQSAQTNDDQRDYEAETLEIGNDHSGRDILLNGPGQFCQGTVG